MLKTFYFPFSKSRIMHHSILGFLFLLLMVFLPGSLSAEGEEGDGDPNRVNFSTGVSAYASDWNVTISWSGGLPGGNCNCSNDNQYIEGHSGGYYSGGALFSHNYTSSRSSGSFTYTAGPSYSATWYLNLRYKGEKENVFTTCAPSVNCNNSERILLVGGANSPEYPRTSRLYNPSNVVASTTEGGGSLLNQVTVTWAKGTDAPEATVGYRVYRNNVLQATLAGDKYEYVDTDPALAANTAYSYKVVTYISDGVLAGLLQGAGRPTTSTGATRTGRTLSLSLLISQGDFINKTKLSWNSVAKSADNIRVERRIPQSNPVAYEELAILNKNATAYTDTDPIPGYLHTYRISPLDGNGDDLQVVIGTGYMNPDGVVRGSVTAVGGAGVQGVQICVTPLAAVSPAGAEAVPALGYCTVTDASGDYEIKDIYYYDEATFVIIPSFPSHVFGPAVRQVTMDLNSNIASGISFTDSTSISIYGQVKFPPAATFGGAGTQDIGIRDVAILLDTLDRGIRTKADGSWSYAVTNPGTYRFTAKYVDHDFDVASPFADASGDTANVIVVDQDIFGVDFIDQNVESIVITIQDGCGQPLGVMPTSSTPRVRVTHEKGPAFFDRYVSVNASGVATIVLPASQFKVKAQGTAIDAGPPFVNPNVAAQLTDTTFSYDLTQRDSAIVVSSDTTLDIIPSRVITVNGSSVTLPADTTYIIEKDSSFQSLQPIADLIYFGPFNISIDFEAAGADVTGICPAPSDFAGREIIVMDVGAEYLFDLTIIDQFSGCEVDTGTVLVYDFVADKERTPFQVPIQNGHAFYLEQPGEPNVASGGANPYQKLFFVSVTAGVRDPQEEGWWILLQGAKELTPTFTSRSPEIPDLIVHDPPGDNSYAWVEKGSSYSSFSNTETEISGSAGLYSDILLGAKVEGSAGIGAEIEYEVGAGVTMKYDINAGRDNFDRTTYETSYSFDETFSTSDDPLFTGYEGDVYIGKAINQLFSIAKVLDFDQSTCIAEVVDKPNLESGGIATTFIYAERHIQGVLIPQIEYLTDILEIQAGKETNATTKADLQAEADSFKIDAYNWNSILAKNAYNRDTAAVFVKNQSFSAGANFVSTQSYNEASGSSYEYVNFIDIDLALGAKWEIEAGLWSEGSVGFAAKFRHSFKKEIGNNSTNSFVVGYQLADKDIGDFFSVDILTDPAYNTPAFRIFGGTSSCPQELGTQARDRANLNIFPPRIDNVPKDGKANFTAQMINESESQESREYQVRVIPQTNPGGAIVTLGGQNISNRPISYFLDAFQANEIDLTVEAGPRSSNYENIAIMMFPPCEYELWENNGNLINGDTFYISANFESECSNVAIISPTANWLVNATNSDILPVDFSGYDLNNPFLESITLEYQPLNQGWTDGPTVYRSTDNSTFSPNDSLEELIFRLFWDVSGVPDGSYKIRARANCTSGKGYTLSSAFSGLIDRNSIAPFGFPTPSDGFLRFGQLISVQFDKDINCSYPDASRNYFPTITLMRTDDSTFIPITTQCREQDDQINIIPSIDLFSMPELEDVILVARIEGIQDPQLNEQTYPIEWAFKVNASPVSWDPDSLNEAFPAGAAPTISSRLKNTAGLSKAFTITDYPSWLTPAVLSGAILADGEYEVNFFVSPDLPIGMYRDTVVATIDGFPEFLDISYEAVAIPPNWSVDPSDYDYSMNVVAVFSLDQTDTNLSRSDKDLIAAIYNGETRGVAQLEYVARFNKYIAFLTVYSNTIANEEINFSLWRAANGVEYTAKETLYFQNDQVYGRMNNPEIFHTDGVYQVIPLDQGWNWVSLNVDNSDMTVQNLLNSLGSPSVGNDVTIKRKDGQTAQFTQIATPLIFSNQWTGPLVQLDNKQGYLLYLSDEPDTLRIPGKPISTFDQIDMLSGWNWIGFQPQVAQPVDQALNSVNVRNGDLLKSQDAFSEYHKGWDTWYGPLQFMEPGQGYKLRLRTGVNYNDLVYSNRLGKDDYQIDHTLYESNMTIVAKIGFEEGLGLSRGQLASDRLLIGAFIDDTCRGYGFLEWVDFMDDYRAVFSAHGNISDVGREMTFRVYDSHSGQEFICPNHPETYISDYFLGNVREPYVLFDQLDLPDAGYFLEQNYPNPYDSKTNIRFILPQQEVVKLSVYDQFGREVQVLIDEELTAGEHTAVFDGSKLPSGVYHYSLQAGEFRSSRKMVKF